MQTAPRTVARGGSPQVAAWPAWWQNGPDTVSWPARGEIDTVEALTAQTEAHLHYKDLRGHQQNTGFTSPSAFTGWHTLGERWNAAAGQVTFYWDGRAVFSHAFIGPYPLYLSLDYQIASNSAPPNLPSGMLVDWVRVWA